MVKKAVSVTLDSDNVLWLKGRARIAGGTLSDTLDKVITQARTGRIQPGPRPSVVGMVDLSEDPDLVKFDARRKQFWDTLTGASAVHEDAPRARRSSRRKSRG